MSWNDYVANFMSNKNCQDAAIVGFADSPGVWAAHPGGCLSKITLAEIKNIVTDDRSSLFVNGLTLGGTKCSVIRDMLCDPEAKVMDLKTKNPDGPSYAVVIAKSCKALVILIAIEGVHCGVIHTLACEMAKYLTASQY
uniref:Profilin n=1 Tax=Leptobrachium leishanense TaxID=445787 RepID=A0A8C5R976_9ANUR